MTSRLTDETARLEEFNVRLVKCTGPILVKDSSTKRAEDANKTCGWSRDDDDDDYPLGHYDHVFDLIFPPEEWQENGQTWRRLASAKPAFRNDVIDLDRELQTQLEYWHANDKGLCRIRRELYSQCFDELIRQVSIINVDQGELLIRIRDEFKATVRVYTQIFEDGLLFGNRKTATAGKKTEKLKNDVESLETENSSLRNRLADANLNHRHLKENLYEELNSLKAANYHEIEFYTGNQDVLKEQVNVLLTMENEYVMNSATK